MGIVYRRKGLPLEDMEFFQFHPTGLPASASCCPRRARGEGGILRNGDGERFMERYAPTIKDLAPRDMVARAMANEVREGRGAGPDKDYVYLDLTHLAAGAASTRSCPDITEFARTYLGVEPVHRADAGLSRPRTTRWAASRPTSRARCSRDNDTVVPGLYAAGECACVSVHGANRLGTNSLLDINVFGRRAGHRRRRVRRRAPTTSSCPRTRRRASSSMIERPARRRRHRAGRRDPQGAAGRRWTSTRRSSAPRRSLKQALTRHRRPARRATRNVAVQDKGKRFNTDLLEAVELGFLLDLAEVLVVSRAGPQGVAAAATSARTTRTATT